MSQLDKNTQIIRMVKEMKKRKVANHEFSKMAILNHTGRISDIRQSGINVSKERVYDSNGKATGTFLYWIPRNKKRASMEYEELPVTPKSNFFNNAMRFFR